MADILGLMGHVQQGFANGKQRGQQTLLGKLSGQAYTAKPEERAGILSGIAAINPAAAQTQQQQFRTGDADRVTQLSQKAKLFVGLARAGNQQAIDTLYPQIAQGAKEAFGIDVPGAYDPSFLQGIEQFANLGAGQAGTGVQSTYIDDKGQRVAILRDGSTQILGQNAPNNQIIDTGDGFYGVNKGNLGAAPVRIGGGGQQQAPQAPQAGMYQTPQGVVRLGDDLSPEQREAAMADIAAGGGAASVQLPDRGVSQPTGGGQQLRSAPKPVSPVELERLRLAQEADKRAAEANARAGRAEERAISGNAVNGRPPTDGQLLAAGFYDRMESAERELEATVNAGYVPGGMRDYVTAGQGPLLNWAATDEGQKYRQQQEDWVRAKLRKESGAVIGDDEMEREIKVYFPQPGDAKTVVDQKAKSRAIAINAMKTAASRALPQQAAASAAPARTADAQRSNSVTPAKFSGFRILD